MKQEARSSAFGLIYIILYLLVLVAVAESEALANNGVVIPFIRFVPAYILLAILGIGLIYIFFKRYIKFDIIAAFLFGRIFMCILPVLFSNVPSSYLGNFVVACFPFFIYVFFYNCNVNLKNATIILVVFGILIALECIWAYSIIQANGYADYTDEYYKTYFVIPVGATNNISAVLLPLVIIGDQTIEKKVFRWGYVILLLLALFLCKSRTGLLLSIAYLILKLFLTEHGKKSVLKKILIFMIPLIILVGILLIKDTELWAQIRSLFLGFSVEGQGLNALLSGRLDLFGDVLDKISQRPIIGNGVSYEKLSMRTHNIFLQMLYENGIVGLIGFLIFLIVCIKQILRSKTNNKYFYAFYVVAPFILINALVEETMLSNFMVLFSLLYLANMRKATNNGGAENV